MKENKRAQRVFSFMSLSNESVEFAMGYEGAKSMAASAAAPLLLP